MARLDISAAYWGHHNISDWKPGSHWEHRRRDSSRTVDIAGTVIESAPPRRLVMSWAFPRDLEAPAKISRVAFDIEPAKDGAVCLTVTHDELESGSEMVKGITRGWPMVLSSLKSFLETDKPLITF